MSLQLNKIDFYFIQIFLNKSCNIYIFILYYCSKNTFKDVSESILCSVTCLVNYLFKMFRYLNEKQYKTYSLY